MQFPFFKITLSIIFLITNTVQTLVASPNSVFIYASQSGEVTLDQGEGGGNPFASAFVEVLSKESLLFSDFEKSIIDLTKEKSNNFQIPDIVRQGKDIDWQFLPENIEEKRIALVFVFSNYSNSNYASLPGAKNDLIRITRALKGANFDVTSKVDPSKKELASILNKFSINSKSADVALIYSTGHGGEIKGNIYLQSTDLSLSGKNRGKGDSRFEISKLGKIINAKKANLVLYGGCRTSLETE